MRARRRFRAKSPPSRIRHSRPNSSGSTAPRNVTANPSAAAYAVYLGTAALNSAAAAPEDAKSYVDTVLESFGVPANR
ncbi:hypothetical protein ACH347_24880 [Saccharopolyspora sp. 5N102]|uniref:hypothetical protein n=1 Tax=Saccharopolyspora sp. 5N102 TaxID=3375155 RepID=UPI0037A58991